MTRKSDTGVYEVGRVEEGNYGNRRGDYVVIRGEKANSRGMLEWKPIDFLNTSKWYAVRVGPTERGSSRPSIVAHLIEEFSSKNDAVAHLHNKIDFDEQY